MYYNLIHMIFLARAHALTHSLWHSRYFLKDFPQSVQCPYWKDKRTIARLLNHSIYLPERARTHSRMVKCSLCDSSPCEHWHMWQNAVNTFAVSVLWFLVNTTTLLGWILRTIVVIRSKVSNLPVRQYDNSRR